MNEKNVLDFVYELGMLGRIEHEGWRLLGIDNVKNVADHSLRAAQIAFFLAKMENYENPYEVVTMVVFHEIGECRTGDIHKVANRYVDSREEEAVKDQTQKLGDEGKELLDLWQQTEHRSTKAGNLAKDADLVEQAVSAKEYIEKGVSHASSWIEGVTMLVKTDSARKLLKALEGTNSNDWWQGLKKY